MPAIGPCLSIVCTGEVIVRLLATKACLQPCCQQECPNGIRKNDHLVWVSPSWGCNCIFDLDEIDVDQIRSIVSDIKELCDQFAPGSDASPIEITESAIRSEERSVGKG